MSTIIKGIEVSGIVYDISSTTSISSADCQSMIDSSISGKADTSTVNAELANKLDASAYTPTDLSNYYNKTEVDNKIASAKTEIENEIPSLNGYATEQWVEDKHYITGVDLSNYATLQDIPTVPTSNTAFTNDAGYLTEHQSLSAYPTTEEVTVLITAATDDMATQTWVNNQGYLTEHQSLDGYATTAYVNTQISSQTSDFVSGEELSSFTYDKSTIDSKITQGGTFDPTLYYDKTATDALLADKLDASAYTPTDLSNYYTKSEVDTALDGKASTNALKQEAEWREATDDLLWDNITTKLPTSAFTAYSASTKTVLDNKLDATAYTPTDLSNYYTKSEVDSSLSGKATTNALRQEAEMREATDDLLYDYIGTKLTTSAFTAYSASTKTAIDNKLDATAYTPTDLSNYYNKTEVDNKVSQSTSGLQQTLSAGTNIQISNNVISATDTTYSAGDGIQISGNTISTTTKFWCGTEAQWGQISGNTDANTIYLIH